MKISTNLLIFFRKIINFESEEEIYSQEALKPLMPTFQKVIINFKEWIKTREYQSLQKAKESDFHRKQSFYLLVQSFLRFKNTEDLILKLVELFFSNLEDIILGFSYIDRDIYDMIHELLKKAYDKNKPATDRIFSGFIKELFGRPHLFIFISNLPLDNLDYNQNLPHFETEINPWISTYAQLLEGPLKHSLFLLLQLELFLSDKKFSHLNIRNSSLGWVLKQIKTPLIQQHYRNAVAHQNIYFTEEQDINKKRIILHDRDKTYDLSIDEFFGEFIKVTKFILTFYLNLFKIYFEYNQNSDVFIENITKWIKNMITIITSQSYEEFQIQDFEMD